MAWTEWRLDLSKLKVGREGFDVKVCTGEIDNCRFKNAQQRFNDAQLLIDRSFAKNVVEFGTLQGQRFEVQLWRSACMKIQKNRYESSTKDYRSYDWTLHRLTAMKWYFRQSEPFRRHDQACNYTTAHRRYEKSK